MGIYSYSIYRPSSFLNHGTTNLTLIQKLIIKKHSKNLQSVPKFRSTKVNPSPSPPPGGKCGTNNCIVTNDLFLYIYF